MQKNEQKASILLWSIFMSLLLGALFITASIQIQNTLSENDTFSISQKNSNDFKNFLTENSEETVKTLKNNEVIVREAKTFYEKGFAEGESIILSPEQGTNLKITVLYGALEINGTTLQNEALFTADGSTIDIKNAAGYSRFTIESDRAVDFPERYYELQKKVGLQSIVKQSGLFTP